MPHTTSFACLTKCFRLNVTKLIGRLKTFVLNVYQLIIHAKKPGTVTPVHLTLENYFFKK